VLHDAEVITGDCRQVMATMPAESVDAIVTDPIYPEIDREYGRISEADWLDLMRGLVAEARRVLKPSGSAVFILQPNSEKAGKLRPWLFDFQSWACRAWNVVQDAYWWNTSALPLGGSTEQGLLRPSVKHAVWVGPTDCYRCQSAVLNPESDSNARDRVAGRTGKRYASRARSDSEGPRDVHTRMTGKCLGRGGTTPFNLLAAGSGRPGGGNTFGHGASTPFNVADWWVRYISPPGGLVLDPFCGSGTVGLAAYQRGRRFAGIDINPGYCVTARRRLADARAQTPLFTGAH
jgi:hypothetical protein